MKTWTSNLEYRNKRSKWIRPCNSTSKSHPWAPAPRAPGLPCPCAPSPSSSFPIKCSVWQSGFLCFMPHGLNSYHSPLQAWLWPLPGCPWATALPTGFQRSQSLFGTGPDLQDPHLNLVSNLPDSVSMLLPTSHSSLHPLHSVCHFLTSTLAQTHLLSCPTCHWVLLGTDADRDGGLRV